MRDIFKLAALVALAHLALVTNAAAQSPETLDNDLRFLVGRYAKHGSFGVAVVDHQGVRAAINARSAYPLASVFKLPLLVAVLAAQDDGNFPSGATPLTIGLSDQCIGSGTLAKRGVGAQVTVDEACQLMMSISDNTATDLLFRKYGEAKLDQTLAGWGFKSSSILLTNRQAWLLSLGQVPGWGPTTPQQRVERWKALQRAQKLTKASEIEKAAANLSLSAFQRIEDASLGTQTAAQDRLLAAELDNKMSALDLATMLVRVDQGQILSDGSKARLLNIMAGQKYHTRLPAKLSGGTRIYHKTGTLSGIINDAGIMYVGSSPDGVAVVFLSQNVTSESAAESLAAQVAKVVQDAYL